MKKNKKFKLLFVCILILIVGVIITRGYSYARYVSNALFNYYLSSKGFYFESKDLSFDTKKHIDTMWDGEKVYFSLSNSSNNALNSEVDIVYEISCEVNEENTSKECLINGTNKSKIEATLSAVYGCSDGTNVTEDICISKNKEWTSKPSSSEFYFEIIDKNGTDVLNANVNLTVVSKKPYKKELSANYNLIRDNSAIGGLSMKYEPKLVNSNLVVTNSYNESKCVAISWESSDFLFDNNINNALGYTTDADGNINSIYFKINKMDSTSFVFYEKDTSISYSELDFKLIESNLCE